jgi:hypothetical protein
LTRVCWLEQLKADGLCGSGRKELIAGLPNARLRPAVVVQDVLSILRCESGKIVVND